MVPTPMKATEIAIVGAFDLAGEQGGGEDRAGRSENIAAPDGLIRAHR